MELNSKEYQIYKNIDFTNRYEKLSNDFQSEKELDFKTEDVLKIIRELGYQAKFIKKYNFYKVEEKIDGIKFYLNISLKYSIAELIIGATKIKTDQFITGDVFGGLYRDVKYAEGVDLQSGINLPSFSTYNDLDAILKEAFSIYEDFKKEVIKEYGNKNV